ncbi:MAG: hypothetical protein K2W33_07560 [Burkholderiales bacterium]|nr:hypothetical protein [Burkholderiales bacterium]
MYTLRTPEGEFNAFDICQAHMQLESDYNVGGILQERPSNMRRNASTGVQLARMKYSPDMRWVDITGMPDDADNSDDEAVRFIYCSNVLAWGLPMDAELAATVERIFTPEALEPYAGRLQEAKQTGSAPTP